MKWVRKTIPILLLIGLLSFPAIASADGELDVDIDILGVEPDVDIDIQAEGADVGVDVTGDNSNVWINGQNINQPTVVHSGGGSGVSGSYVKKKVHEAVDPLYSWAQQTQTEMTLTMDGLAKVIVTMEGQSSQFEQASADVDELHVQVGVFCTQLREDLEAVETNLTKEQKMLSLKAAEDERDMLYQIELAKWEGNRNLVIVSGVFLIVILCVIGGLRRRIARGY